VREFVNEHRSLLLKHARIYVRANAEKIPAEDVAREIELVVMQLAKERGVDEASVKSPDLFIRTVVRHAAGRAKRRRKLIEQVAAGDDLQAFTDDLAALDRDLPDPPAPSTPLSQAARTTLDGIKDALKPRDALVFALLIEDDATVEDVARSLAMPLSEVHEARVRILTTAAARGLEAPDSQARGLT
jgi:DNA-directed RNA polymerase specialized sigma24 family protein